MFLNKNLLNKSVDFGFYFISKVLSIKAASQYKLIICIKILEKASLQSKNSL